MGVRFNAEVLRYGSVRKKVESGLRPGPLFFVVLPLLLLAGCSLESPKAPSWTVNLTVPLVSRHYDIPYIIEHADREELVWDSVSGARFEVERTLDTIFVGDNIVFADLTQSYSDSLGLVSLWPSQTLAVGISLVEHYGGPAGDVPGLAIQTQKEFPPLSEVQSAEVDQGAIRIQVTNNFALVIDSLELVIADLNSAVEIGRAVFAGTINSGETRSSDLDLSGKMIGERIGLTAFIRTPGGYLESVEGKTIEITASFPDSLTVTGGVAVIPAVEKTFADTIDFSAEIQADEAVFSGGRVNVEVANGSNLDFDVELVLPDLTRDGYPLRVTGHIGAQSSAFLYFELAHTAYNNPVVGTTPLRVQVNLQTPGSAVPVAVSAADRFTIEVGIEAPVIESVTGILPATIQDIDGLQAEIDLPEGFEGIGLAAGELQLEVISSLPFPGEFEIELTGDRRQSLTITGEILPAVGGEPIASQVNVADAATLLSPIPATITAHGTVSYGDGVTAGTARSDDFIVPSFRLIAPLSLYLDNVEYSGKTEGVELPGESDDYAERFGAASITAEFDNHLPFGVAIEVRLAARRADLPDNPDLILGPTEISPALVDENGRTIGPVTTSDVFSITSEQSRIFEGDSLFITEEIRFFSSNGSVVTLRDSDYVNWRALLQIEVELSERDWASE